MAWSSGEGGQAAERAERWCEGGGQKGEEAGGQGRSVRIRLHSNVLPFFSIRAMFNPGPS